MSAVAPFEFAAPLTVAIDFKSPFAYLAVAPTRALEIRLGFTADWVPLLVAPLMPPEPATRGDDRGTRHRRMRATYFARDLERYAQARGIDLADVHRPLDVALAAAGLAWLRGHDRTRTGAYVERTFSRIWQPNPANVGVADVAGLLGEVGADGQRFAADLAGALAELADMQARLAAAGLFSVPSYVVAGDVFVGRQHLPMVEWLLTGRRGAVPI
jgi:2-hydroxychromene-2-carboxylate isomerase